MIMRAFIPCFFGVFTKLQKAAIKFVIPVRLRMEKVGLQRMDYRKILLLKYV
jgi:hypothetical protein